MCVRDQTMLTYYGIIILLLLLATLYGIYSYVIYFYGYVPIHGNLLFRMYFLDFCFHIF